jgi:predicted nucleotidyltransferase
MIKGITPQEEQIIKQILSKYPYEFYYYGSRVKGDYTKSSDLDILLKSSKSVDYIIPASIEREFNESKIPYIVNISEYDKMDKDFYKLIEKDLVKVL